MKNVLALINIVFWSVALLWVISLEKKACACSKDWRRDYMKYYFIAAILFQFLLLSKNPMYLKIASPFMALAFLVYLYATVTYIQRQKRRQCHCSESTERTVLFFSSIIQIIVLACATVTLIAA